jgi:DNA polymerase-3 subunit alpha
MAVPDINRSSRGFKVDGEAIRFPLDAIKSLQSNFIEALLDERQENGLYRDLFDFASRSKPGGLTLTTLVRLIDAGALDSLCPSRASLRATAGAAMSYAEMMFGESGQEALLAIGIEKPAMVASQDDLRIALSAEYEALGIMVSGSPLSFYAAKLKERAITPLGEIDEAMGEITTAGIVKSLRAITTRKGSQMAFLELYDEVSERSFILFSEAYAACYSLLKTDAIVVIQCHKDNRQEGSYLVDGATSVGE